MALLSCGLCVAIILAVGLVLKKLWSLLYVHYIGYSLGQTAHFKSFGKWCLITGCTSGIGRSYAYAFAKRGIDLVLVSRNKSKLDGLAKDIQEKYGVETKIIVADFIKGFELYDEIESQLKGLDIGILVNNVGMMHKVSKFCDIPNAKKLFVDLTNTNIAAHVMMTLIVLPRMARKNKGIIIFISSVAALTPSMEFQLYGATKAYVDYLAGALNLEYSSKGLIIQSVLPGAVQSNMVRSKMSMMSPSSDVYVEGHLKTVGLTKRTVGYFPHNIYSILIRLLNCLPASIGLKLAKIGVERSKTDMFSYQQ